MKNIFKSRRLRRFGGIRATARVFLPSVGKRLIVIPFKTISIIPIILLLSASVYLFLRSDIFLVKNITIDYSGGVEGDERYADGFVSVNTLREFISQRTTARSILTLQLDALEAELQALDSILGQVNIHRRLPDTLLVDVKEVPVVALLEIQTAIEGPESNAKSWYLINEEGILFKALQEPIAVPLFTYAAWVDGLEQKDTYTGATLPEGIISQILEVIEHVRSQTVFNPESYSMVDDFTMHITTEDEVTLVITFDKSIEDQVRDISVVLDQLALSDREAKRIDARFDKIFVEYK